jgi:hypothetical protein
LLYKLSQVPPICTQFFTSSSTWFHAFWFQMKQPYWAITDWMTHSLTHSLSDVWLVWLIWLFYWLVNWLLDQMIYWLFYWLVDRSIDWLMDWLVGLLIYVLALGFWQRQLVNLMFCWPCISIYACNETNLTHYLSSVYSINPYIPLHVSGLLVAHHQEETMYICNKWYVLYVLVECQLAWLGWAWVVTKLHTKQLINSRLKPAGMLQHADY